MVLREQGLPASLWSVLRAPVSPTYRGSLSLLWLVLLLFAVQIATGTLLSFYYQPSPETASESVQFVMRDVDWGWLVRGVHHWAAVAMIVLGVAQLALVLAFGGYRGGRGGAWCLGLLLLGAVLALTFTGEALRWDEAAHARVHGLAARLETLPLAGETLAVGLRGGSEIGAATLSRLYASHVALLPWCALSLALLQVWFLVGRRRTEAAG